MNETNKEEKISIFEGILRKIINLFTLPKDWSLKRRWNFWGGGGRVNWWIRKHITFD
jgi:hypothetical protein